MTRVLAVLVASGLAGLAALPLSPPAAGQSGPGWITIVDGKTMGDWDTIGEANWRIEDGALVADKRTGKVNAYLVGKISYKDVQIHAEFWASDDANSGVFFRCTDPKKVGGKTCYEANIYDRRPDIAHGTGAITGIAAANPMLKAGGKWNTFEITAKGPQIVLVMNGTKTAEANDGTLPAGPVALQYIAGTIKFRKVALKPL